MAILGQQVLKIYLLLIFDKGFQSFLLSKQVKLSVFPFEFMPFESGDALYLQIRLVRSEPASEEFTRSFTLAHNVYHSYQMIIHKDPPNKPSVAQYTRFLCDSPLEVNTFYLRLFGVVGEVSAGQSPVLRVPKVSPRVVRHLQGVPDEDPQGGWMWLLHGTVWRLSVRGTAGGSNTAETWHQVLSFTWESEQIWKVG